MRREKILETLLIVLLVTLVAAIPLIVVAAVCGWTVESGECLVIYTAADGSQQVITSDLQGVKYRSSFVLVTDQMGAKWQLPRNNTVIVSGGDGLYERCVRDGLIEPGSPVSQQHEH